MVKIELDPRERGHSRFDLDPPNTGKSGMGGIGWFSLVDEGKMSGV